MESATKISKEEAKNQRSSQTATSSNSSGKNNNNNNNSSNCNNNNNNNSNTTTTTNNNNNSTINNNVSSKNYRDSSNSSSKALTNSNQNTGTTTTVSTTTTSSSPATTTTTVTSNITKISTTTTTTTTNSSNSIAGGLCTSTTTACTAPSVSSATSTPHEGNVCGTTNMSQSGSGGSNGSRHHHQQQQCVSISSTMNNDGVAVVPVSSSKTPSSAHTFVSPSSSNLLKMNEPQSTADSTTASSTRTSHTEERDRGFLAETPADCSPSSICSPLTPPSSLSNFSVSSSSSAAAPIGLRTPTSYYDHYSLGTLSCSESPTHNYLSSGVRSSYNNVATTPSMRTSTVAGSGGVAIGGGPYNWQASKVTVKERLAYLFNTDIMSDVRFQVGKPPNSQLIPAHKFVLSVGSAVFDALFTWMKCSPSSNDNVIEIPDVEPAAFLALLRFLYCDEVLIDPETVMTTLYAAKKYSVPALEKACVDFLKRNLSSDNAFMLLTQARLFDEPQLAALCLETIDKNTSEALAADGFTDIDIDTMCVVLERNSLGIRECKLFSAICRWAEAECSRQNLAQTPANQRKVLGKALKLIRFPLMSVEEFAMGAAQSGILLDREVVELFLHFTVNPKPPISFSDVPRCCLTGKEQIVLRFCQIESRWGYSGTSDRIRFMVNRRIFVVGFGLYGSIHGPTEYFVNIELLHSDTGRILGQNDTSFQCDGSTSTFRVMFKKPVEILPNTSFTACATLKGPDSYYGSRGLRKVTHESVASGKVTFQFTYATGNNNGTSVEDGQIPEIIFYT